MKQSRLLLLPLMLLMPLYAIHYSDDFINEKVPEGEISLAGHHPARVPPIGSNAFREIPRRRSDEIKIL
jgi:hypothetical protein